MKYLDFRQTFWSHRLIRLQDMRMRFPGFDLRRLHEWSEKKYIIKISNGAYVFAENLRGSDESLFFQIANRLYPHSYISMESALSHYGLIPEAVFHPTSVSTLKTMNFKTPLGNFRYHNVSEALFFGYTLTGSAGNEFLMAVPEKALLDLVHLRRDLQTSQDLENLRLDITQFRKMSANSRWKRYLNAVSSFMDQKKLGLLRRLIND